MRMLNWVASMGLACLAGAAWGDGIKVDATGGYWFGAETRLRLQAVRVATPPLRLGTSGAASLNPGLPYAASLTGDYYLSSSRLLDGAQPRSGFRASGSLLIHQPGVSVSELALASRSALSFGQPARLGLGAPSVGLGDAQAYGVSTVPYVGIGYSDFGLKSGWGWWADVGLLVQSPGGALGLGRVVSGSQGLDDVLRDLRMAPMVQLGVNYAF